MLYANDHEAGSGPGYAGLTGSTLYDPTMPIMFSRRGPIASAMISRPNQRLRRAHILATIRQLLSEGGPENVTMRKIADVSGHAVQTIYNLVGPRDHAIVEAIGEYTRFVGRTAAPNPEDPNAVSEIIERWFQSIVANPDFCRQVSLIALTDARAIFYTFRDRQLKGMHSLLLHQQKCGVIRPEIDTRELSEMLVLLASALCVEWADRPCPLEKLQRRLYSGSTDMLAGALAARRACTGNIARDGVS